MLRESLIIKVSIAMILDIISFSIPNKRITICFMADR